MKPPEDRAAHETRPTTTPPPPAADPGAPPPEVPGARIPGGPDARAAEGPEDRDDSYGPEDREAEYGPEDREAEYGPEDPEAEYGLDGDLDEDAYGPEEGAADDPDDESGPIGRLSLPGRIVVALAVAAVSVGAVFHIGMVFLHVAPPNTLSTQYAQAVTDYIYPEFEQNWKLFAPDPVQVNTDVEARAQVAQPGGATTTTGWVDLTAMDIAKIRHDPFPSHTVQNELRRAWDFYTSAHDAQDRPIGLRGTLSQQYLLRIVANRFGPHVNGGTVRSFQVRVETTPVASPVYSAQKNAVTPSYRVLSWWNVTPEDFS